ncbi:MAG: M56 family metallopeptidase [Candidatus Eremiobacteraeota bacterium]|nr:M56 family metallopeptidase [Candidatus Eremiobacteraeota bacterium]
MSSAATFGNALDAVWQGILICAVVVTVLRIAPRSSATTRSAIWSAALVACIVAALVGVAARHTPAGQAKIAPPVHATDGAVHLQSVRAMYVKGADPRMSGPMAISPVERITAIAPRAERLIVLFLLLIAAVRCCALAFEAVSAWRLRRLMTRIEAPLDDLPVIRRRYAFVSSATAETPHVLGFGRPLIVLPSALLEQSRERLRSVVLHELAHVRRYDDVRGALEALLAAVIWWDPGVRFARERIARLR